MLLTGIRFIANDAVGNDVSNHIPWWFVAIGAAVYIGFSFKTVGPDQQGLVLLMGKPIETVQSGLVIVPPPFCRLRRETTTTQQWEFPAEPEDIFYGDLTKVDLPPGKFPPIRINSGPPSKDARYADIPVDNPYNKEMAYTIAFTVSFRVLNLEDFIRVVGSIDKARKILQDIAEGIFFAKLSKISPAQAKWDIEEVRADLIDRIENRVQGIVTLPDNTTKQKEEPWGIEITDVTIKPFGFSHALNASVTDIPIAQQTAIKTQIDAEATAKKTVTEGDATATARRASYKADEDNAAAMAAIANTAGGRIALANKTMSEAYGKSKHTIIDGSNIMGVAGGIASLVKNLGENDAPTPPESTPPTPTPQPITPPPPTPQPQGNPQGHSGGRRNKGRRKP